MKLLIRDSKSKETVLFIDEGIIDAFGQGQTNTMIIDINYDKFKKQILENSK